jgi:hypothetical protein
MHTQARILFGSQSVGTASVDSTRVRGEGILLAPMLMIPLGLELDQRSPDEQLALVRIEVGLWLDSPQGSVQLGVPVIAFGDGAGNNLWLTSETHSYETSVELRFALTADMARLVEETARSLQAPSLPLSLKIKPALACVVGTEQVMTRRAGQSYVAGAAYELRPVASSTVLQLDVHLQREEWTSIAQGFGLHEVRLIAVRLPRRVEGLDSQLVSLFDEAVTKYETRDYRSAIGLCRDIRHIVEKSLGAKGSKTVDQIIAEERGLTAADAPIQFLSGAWKLFVDLTNDARHAGSVGVYNAADARAALLFTAVLLEYLADTLRRRL